jgi:integrase
MRRRYPTISQGPDNQWHAWVSTGDKKPNGRPRQRHIKRKTEDEVRDEIDRLLDLKKEGARVRPGRAPTVQQWLDGVYLATIAPLRIDPTTVQGYRSKLRNYVFPVIGNVRMDKLQPEHLEAVYLDMRRKGRADATVLQVHRIMSRAVKIAHKRRVVPFNPAPLIEDVPTAKHKEMDPLTEAEADAVLAAVEGRRNAARWYLSLGLGLRQGEALGLRWSYVNLDAGELRVWWQLHRRAYEHGCVAASSGATSSNLAPTCGRRRGGNCPQRRMELRSGEIPVEGGLILKEPKGKSKREVPLPAEFVAMLRAHREVQELERMMANGAYTNHGFVFATPLGGPVSPEADWQEWKAILKTAGVDDARVHDGRHTAGTLLLAQGTEIRVVQKILGHSSVKVTEGYAHVVDKLAREATERMGKSLLKKRGGSA